MGLMGEEGVVKRAPFEFFGMAGIEKGQCRVCCKCSVCIVRWAFEEETKEWLLFGRLE